MSNEVVVRPNQDISFTPEQKELLKRTICEGATDDELKLFMHVCKRSGLDPFARQIYAVKRNDGDNGKQRMTIQTSIDGFRLAASRSGEYAGSDDAVFDNEENPKKATVTVYRMVSGQRCPFTATARWSEYFPGDKKGFMWKKMPHVMLAKVAEALALRKAFPADLSGVYAKEEMDQADNGPAPPAVDNQARDPVVLPKENPAPTPNTQAQADAPNCPRCHIPMKKSLPKYGSGFYCPNYNKTGCPEKLPAAGQQPKQQEQPSFTEDDIPF